jgi:transposase
MRQFFGCDAHKKYSLFVGMDEAGHTAAPVRVEHDRLLFRSFLQGLPHASSIAVETVGNWYWMIEEIEKAEHVPFLAHAGKAKLMMGQINKTDKLDAKGLALLLRNGTLPSVWIPPGELRDQRELPRMRMALVRVRTMLKNRIHANLAKFAIRIEEVSDLFGARGRQLLRERLVQLPVYTRGSVEVQLQLLDQVEAQIEICEKQIQEVVALTPEMKLLLSLPGVGSILAVVIALEVGQVDRFPGGQHLASYGGTVPRVHSSGGRTFYGRVRPDVNRYLKWALVEAANCVVLHQHRMPQRHTAQLYRRIRARKGHAKAVVAVARHLAEATYWILKKGEPYREPQKNQSVLPTRKEARCSHES